VTDSVGRDAITKDFESGQHDPLAEINPLYSGYLPNTA